MQRIYNDGKEHLELAIPNDWAIPEKTVNRRCPTRVVELINVIRSAADDHQLNSSTLLSVRWMDLPPDPRNA